MTFRRKLLIVFSLAVFLSVAAVTLLVSEMTRRAFARSDDERTAALVAQFRREFAHEGEEVTRQVERIANTDPVNRMPSLLKRTPADSGPYFELAKSMGANDQLDFLEFMGTDGTIISSAQWPEQFGYKEDSFSNFTAASEQTAFLNQESLPDGTALGLFAVRPTVQGEHSIYVIGGRKIDRKFLSGLGLLTG